MMTRAEKTLWRTRIDVLYEAVHAVAVQAGRADVPFCMSFAATLGDDLAAWSRRLDLEAISDGVNSPALSACSVRGSSCEESIP